MAELTPEERKKEAAEVFAAGMELFESRREERLAKERAANPPKEEEKKDDDGASKPFLERLLGF